MIFVSFHGGKGTGCITNIYAYSTNSSKASVLTHTALSATATDAELRAFAFQNGYLYVADGAKASSIVTYYKPVNGSAYQFDTPQTFVKDTLSKKGNFTTSISHPYSIVFDANNQAFIGNQDTNVVSLVAVNADGSGTLNAGVQSPYLKARFPTGVFLDGTFVASQVGSLPNVDVTAADVPPSDGGLGIWPLSGKVQHSVRDVAISAGSLIVCDEAGGCLRVYSLAIGNGTYLNALCGLGSNLPTHLQIVNGGLYVSAGAALCWAPVPNSNGNATAPFVNILGAPARSKIAGLAFNVAPGASSGVVYAAFQTGSQGGSVVQYTFSQSTPASAPTLTGPSVFVDSSSDPDFTDTPEFLVYQPDPS